VLSDQRFYRSSERGVMSAERFRLPFWSHERCKLIRVRGRPSPICRARAGDKPYIAYCPRRQSSSGSWELVLA
jgi:hypothetical protein